MAANTAFLLLFLSFIPYSLSISCLVIRPGYGLVSEKCPPSAIGCRIRVMSDRIDWYEWAKLYDRNQLVCVYPEEYKTESGCQKKTSGSIRCWCGGKDDCNDAENSKALYEEYAGRMGLKHNRVKISTTTPTTTTTTTRRSTPRKVTPKRIQIKTTTTQRTTTTIRPTTERKEQTTTTMAKTTTRMAETKKFPDVEAHPLPTDDKDKYDEIFAETRRQLEAQMKEEDERLQTMLADEEEEMREEEEEEQTTRTAEEQNRLDRRERARQEERRRQEEEERLARIEREEAEESARQTRERQRKESDEDEEEEFEEFGMTSFACSHLSMLLFVFLIR